MNKIGGFRVTTMLGAFAVSLTLSAHATPSQNGKIAFVSDRNGQHGIYVMNADGTNQVRITTTGGNVHFPRWSPDGRWIAFFNSGSIYLVKANGTGQTLVTSHVPLGPVSWSPDGRKLAFSASSVGAGNAIFTVNVDGTGMQNITTNLTSSDSDPVWSPDGSKILFTRYGSYPPVGYHGTMLHSINVDGTDLRPLLNGFADGWNEDVPDWSPGVNRIVYRVNVWDFNAALYTANPDGSDRRLFDGAFGSDDRLSASWAPDGSKIVFDIWDRFHTDAEIYVKSFDGSPPIRLTNTPGRNFEPSWQPLTSTVTPFDYDGDGNSDVSSFRPSDGVWHLNRSTDGVAGVQWGSATDKIAPADYDGDGKTDVAVYRPSEGRWYLLNSSNGTYSTAGWGVETDIPTPGDYDSDGRADVAIFRPSDGNWWIDRSTEGMLVYQFGASGDHPVVGDYDGDGRTDAAVFRPSTGVWYIFRSTAGVIGYQFGISTDKVTPADYDGDGKTDLAVYRPSEGKWYVANSGGNPAHTAVQFGTATDIPVPADYDGDGKADIAIFRPSDGYWWINRTTAGLLVKQFGVAGDKPTPNAFGN